MVGSVTQKASLGQVQHRRILSGLGLAGGQVFTAKQNWLDM